jgi:hypothetical protein
LILKRLFSSIISVQYWPSWKIVSVNIFILLQ